MAPFFVRRPIVAMVMSIILVIVAVFWFGGPYAALHGLRKAVAARDTSGLDTYIDFPTLRHNLAPQIENRISRGISARLGGVADGALAIRAAKVLRCIGVLL